MSASGLAGDLDAAIDELYRGPLDAFTSARNDLAASLRKAGRRAEADGVKALAKPSVTAWAVNHVWWTEPSALAEVLEAGAAERAAHMARASSRSADVRAAADRRSRAVAAVVDAALGALGAAGRSADARFRIAGTVDALASSGMPAGVAPGRLTRDLQSSGLDAFGASPWAGAAALTSGPRPGPVPVTTKPSSTTVRPDADRAAQTARHRAEQRAEATARAVALDDAEAEAARQRAACDEALARAREAFDTAGAAVADLEQRLEQARLEAAESRRRVQQATREASEAELFHRRAARAAARAREERDALETDRP